MLANLTTARVELTELPENHPLDLRAHRRYRISLPVEYKWILRGKVAHLGSGTTVDISSGGVCFQSEERPPANGQIEIALNWPFLLEGVCALKLLMRGRVVRSDGRGIAVAVLKHEFRTAGSRSGGLRS
jgi:hypothetical protein